ncbi:DUF3541 domain-containing protein [Zooshikella harenae]|uniref:DUF3541 domain-containing protein n=1 Tax=Zooshikella harenae TaxID=2827238 RepID=A0ABS5ZGN5_9GAMM|nr:DUF3541 domain-containing protein [Zooshikella harenae]MBU2712410.1 DUF3541 domain-containing protein [Zooshikella harenae]
MKLIKNKPVYAKKNKMHFGLSLKLFLILSVTLTVFFGPSSWASNVSHHESLKLNQQASSVLRETLESALFTLPPRKQGHFGIRLYRLTGSKKYLATSLYDIYVVADRLDFIANHLDDENYIKKYVNHYRRKQPDHYKGNLRRQVLARNGEFIFYSSAILPFMNRLDELGLKSVHNAQLYAALKKYDFRSTLLKPEVIRAWAAQSANWVYWLHQLDIVDLRKSYKEAFIKTFEDDLGLKGDAYTNKIYGLTHFIFAASRYYQQSVDKKEFAWIYDYFEKNIARILRETKPDVIAEVGVSFLLAGDAYHPVVKQCRQSILQAIDKEHKMIPSVDGEWDLARGEHRNVLAFMLFYLPRPLHPGPYLANDDKFRSYLPKNVVIKSIQR